MSGDVGRCPRAVGSRIARLPQSGIREVYERALNVPGCIHLEVGEPNFATPPHIVEAAARAARDGFTKYTASRGYASLLEALVKKLKRCNALDVSPSDILVTTGGVTALFEAIVALVEPGDVVLLPDPGWPNSEAMVLLASGRPVRYPLLPEAGYQPDLDALRDLAQETSPCVIYINSPANPTGAVFSSATIQAVCEIADKVGAYVLSDECYESITFDALHVSAAIFMPERVFTAFSFSKTYAMTGWRVGYLVTPLGVGEYMTKVQEPIISCATGIAQKAAEAALIGPQVCVDEMVSAYRARRDRVVELLSGTGLLLAEPHGAFYAMVDISAAVKPSRTFALDLVRDWRLAVAPGGTFGPSGDHAVRISLAADLAALEEGVGRLVAVLGQGDSTHTRG